MKLFVISCVIWMMLFSPLARASEVRAYVYADSIWSGTAVVVDGQFSNRHFFAGFSDLSDAMKSNPRAAEFAKRSSHQAIWGNSFVWAGLAGALVYGFSHINGDHFDTGTYWGIFFAGFVPGIFCLHASEINLFKAINAYNGVLPKSAAALLPDDLILAPSASGQMTADLSWSF